MNKQTVLNPQNTKPVNRPANIVNVRLDRDAEFVAESIIALLDKKIMVKIECQGGYYYITSKPFTTWVSGDKVVLNYGEVVVTINVKDKTVTEEFKF